MNDKPIFLYSKVRDVKSIERGTSKSAGIDFFIPTFTHEFMTDFVAKNPCVSMIRPETYSYLLMNYPNLKSVFLAPHERLLIPSGIKLKGHDSTALIMFNKSGVSVKKGLDILACVIDSDYMGEIHISILNTSNHIVEIKEGEKIIQGTETPIIFSEFKEVPEAELFKNKTERGSGGFGSTNKNKSKDTDTKAN